MWEEVLAEDRTALLRCAAIVGQMHIGYDHVDIARVQSAMSFHGLRVYFYRDGNFQLVLSPRRSPILRRWDIFAMGYFGATPAQSAETMAQFVRDFMLAEESAAMYMLCPRSAAFDPFASQLRTRPEVRVVVTSTSELGERWTIDLPPNP